MYDVSQMPEARTATGTLLTVTECLLLSYEGGAGRMIGLELGGDGGFDVGGGHGRGTLFDFWEGTWTVWFGGHGQVCTVQGLHMCRSP
jgi:hypothetical protein